MTFYHFFPTKYLGLCKQISTPTFTNVQSYYQLIGIFPFIFSHIYTKKLHMKIGFMFDLC